jgi:hypothetical protein
MNFISQVISSEAPRQRRSGLTKKKPCAAAGLVEARRVMPAEY